MPESERESPLDPRLIASLATPDAYPHDPSVRAGRTSIDVVQTHISHVFLTGERVYKLRKSVDVGFVSFLLRSARNRDCVRELHLNRRLSPDVYLGLAEVVRDGDRFRVGPLQEPPAANGALPDVEHCVVMRRLPAGRDARSLLEAGRLSGEQIDRVALRIADFHAQHRLGRPSPFSSQEWQRRIEAPVLANFDSLLAPGAKVSQAEVEALRERTRAAFARLLTCFERRRVDGRAVDAHGDLHLQHVWFETDDAKPTIIDCLEFDDALRRIDAASELAFLAMDLAYRGHPGLGERLLARYARATGDFDLYRVVDFFVAYRAAVRGKVAAIEARDAARSQADRDEAARRTRRRVAFATRALDARPPGRLVLVGGIVGTGKSTAARVIADALDGVTISSDELRRLGAAAGPKPSPGEWEKGRYAPEATGRIYDEMLACAEAVVSSGRTAVLDASWARRERRKQARDDAARLGARIVFAEVRCPREVALARLEARQREGRDPSEAGPSLYDSFAAAYDPVENGEWPAADRTVVHTDEPAWRDGLREWCATLRSPLPR